MSHQTTTARILAAGVILLAAGGAVAALSAASVRTIDGSVLKGTLVAIGERGIEFKTSYAGTVTVDMEQVSSIRSERAFTTLLESGNRLVGRFVRDGDEALIETELGRIDISGDRIVAAAPEGTPLPSSAPAADGTAGPQPAAWTYEGSVDIGGKTGNTERISAAASLAATRSSENETLKLFATTEKTEEDGSTSADQLRGGMDFEQLLSPKQSWYSRVSLERDDIEDVELRTIAALGYGHYFLRSPDHKIRGRIGSLFRHESYEDNSREESMGVDLSLHNDWALSAALRMLNELTYTPSVEDSSDYRLSHSSSIETPLQLTGGDLRLRLGINNEYDSQPVAGIDRLDSSYLVRLVLGW